MKNKSKQAIQTVRRIYHYDEDEWERSYLSPRGDGFVVTQWERIEESKASKAERLKFEKEMRMCKVLADNGYAVEFLHGVQRPAGQTYDIRLDGIKTDLKCVSKGPGNIVKYVKKALNQQGCEAVVMEIPSPDKDYFNALAEARRKQAGRIIFFVKDENIVKEVK